MLSLRDRIGVLCASAGMFVSAAGAIDGPRVPKPGEPAYDNASAADQEMFDAMESVCAVGFVWDMTDGTLCNSGNPPREHKNTGTGLLVAPNVVITANHVLDRITHDQQCNPNLIPFGVGGVTVQGWDCGDGLEPRLVVRFRKNPDDSYGTKAAGWESYYQVPVKRVVFLPHSYSNNSCGEAVACKDPVALILADSPSDPGFEDGWITHLDPIPIAGVPLPIDEGEPQSAIVYGAGWGERAADAPGQPSTFTKGILRYIEDVEHEIQVNSAGSVCPLGTPVYRSGLNGEFLGEPADSGGPALFRTEAGEIVGDYRVAISASAVIAEDEGVFDASWMVFSELDVSGSADPTSSEYGELDYLHTIEDALHAWYGFSNGTGEWFSSIRGGIGDNDFSTSGDPVDPGYGVPDGAITVDDVEWFLNEMLTGENRYHAIPMMPMPAGGLDLNGDGRFNQFDLDLQLAGSSGAIDFDNDGDTDSVDAAYLQKMLEPFGAMDSRTFGHGILGDLDGDHVVDCTDQSLLSALLVATPDLFHGGYATGDQEYVVELDADLNGELSSFDQLAVSPFDVATAGADITDLAYQPDGLVDRWDALKLMRAWSTPAFDDIGDVDGDGDEDADDRWAFAVGRDQCGTPTSDVFNWGLDANGDGRWDYRDIQVIQVIADASGWDPDWDLDGDTVITSNDRNVAWNLTYLAGGSPSLAINHGVLGDENLSDSALCNCNGAFGNPIFNGCFDGTFCPMAAPFFVADCTDLAAMTPVAGPDNDPFDGYVYGDASYRFDLDFDLDGDNDQDDWVAIFGILEPADFFSPDGQVTISDHNAYLAAFSSQDPIADVHPVGAPDGMINIVDLTVFLTWYDNGTGLCN